VREAASLIHDAGGMLCGVVIAMDRQEVDADGQTAVEKLATQLSVPVLSLLTLQDVIEYLDSPGLQDNHQAGLKARIQAYQRTYCASASRALERH